jgi:hypothetical protein
MSTKIVDKQDALTLVYAKKIAPLIELAQKAYGLRGQDTSEHRASAKYTALLKEYYAKGGQLVPLSKELGVHYSGLRRRVFSSDTSTFTARKRRSTLTLEQTEKWVEEILKAKEDSEEAYHNVVFKAYQAGASLAAIAKKIGISSSAPLYYAVNRHETRLAKKRSA